MLVESTDQSMGSTQLNEKVITRQYWPIQVTNRHLHNSWKKILESSLGIFLCWENIAHWWSCLEVGSGWEMEGDKPGRKEKPQQQPWCQAQHLAHAGCVINMWITWSPRNTGRSALRKTNKGTGCSIPSHGVPILPVGPDIFLDTLKRHSLGKKLCSGACIFPTHSTDPQVAGESIWGREGGSIENKLFQEDILWGGQKKTLGKDTGQRRDCFVLRMETSFYADRDDQAERQ